jgi:hypothetical protein
MAYIYLLNLYEKIDLHLNEAHGMTSQADITENDKRFHQGRVDILSEFRQFTSDQLDRKLPKRIRKKLYES